MADDRYALIMGLGHPRQEPFYRSYHRAGIKAVAAHTEEKAKQRSKYLSGFIHLPLDPEGQLQALEAFGQKHPGAFLVATNDDYLGLVSQNRARLDRYFTIPLPDWDIIEPMIDRQLSYRIAEPLGIKVPGTWEVSTREELEQTIAALDTDASDFILKTHSVLSEPADAAGIRQTKPAPRDKAAMLAASEEIQSRTGVYPLIQEVIPGFADAAVGVTMVVGPTGTCELAYCVQRLRLSTYKLGGEYIHPYVLGSVVWCQTVHDPEAIEATKALTKAFGYTGVVTIEFRRHPETGALYLMKVEPRPVRATSLATQIGMDIPMALYAAFNGEKVHAAKTYPEGVQWLWIQPYLRSLFTNDTKNRGDLLRLFRQMRGIRSFGEDLSDPIPLIAGTAKIAGRALASALRGGR